MRNVKTTKIAPSKIELNALTKKKIKIYVEHGFVLIFDNKYRPVNSIEAYKHICPNELWRKFKTYCDHVEQQLQLTIQ